MTRAIALLWSGAFPASPWLSLYAGELLAELFYLHLQIAVFFTQDVALRRCFLAKGRKPTMVGNELPNLRL
ncbi:MAG: hypothetical protein ACLURY_02145 [Alistipes putredinis]